MGRRRVVGREWGRDERPGEALLLLAQLLVDELLERVDGLSADEKRIVTEVAAEATTFQRQVSRAQADEALADLKKAGMQVTEFSPAELQRLRDKVKPVVDKHTASVGEATVKALYDELAKVRK